MTGAPTNAVACNWASGWLRRRLREGTAEAHGQLEAELDVLSLIADRQRAARVLERFFGFHVIWEQAIRQHAAIRAFQEPRSRLPHLRRDLAALGFTGAEQADAPRCAEAAALAADRPTAIGSLYVVEGSTLGGQVIDRALAAAACAPPGGLAYFNPYGARTGVMWRAFGDWAEGQLRPAEAEAAVDGARRTFSMLQAWLAS